MNRISVIIPCYNVERWLPACLRSVFAALPAEAEVFAVDDGSTDSTLSVLGDFARTEPRLRVLPAAHAGVSAARNRALDLARGEFVFFVDPDDTVEPDFFTAMTEAIVRDGADCCLCGYSEHEDGSDARRTVRLKADYRFRSNAEILASYLPRIFGYSFGNIREWYAGTPLFARREMGGTCRMAYRRALIEARHVRFDETISLYEDAMFNAEFFLGASVMTSVDRPLYNVTCRDSGAMRSVPRDDARYCRNKLRLLRKRDELDRLARGALAPLYAGTNVLSALEILSHVVRCRIGFAEGWRTFAEYLFTPSVRAAVAGFPLSARRPVLALAVLALRGACNERRWLTKGLR